MSQHFLLSKAARSLSLARVARLSDGEAFDAFRLIRWSATKGEPVCPRCDCAAVYTYKARKLWKCKACSHQFYVTSGTIFASRKLPIRDYLLAIAIFVNGAKGHSALQLSRDWTCSTRQPSSWLTRSAKPSRPMLTSAPWRGHVEVDGAYFGGYVKPANNRENRRDRRLAVNQTGKRKVVVHARAGRRAEIGIHHHIAGPYLQAYSQEMAWREDHRRVSNGEQYLMATEAALRHPVSRVWKGYWQRAAN